MASDVELVNQALSLLGDDPITSLGDNTERARLANRILGPTKDAVLRAHPWSCATSRALLGQLSGTPVSGWAYQFQLPSDPYCLRVLALNDDQESGDPGDDFKIEGRKLMTNSATAAIRFIGRITDPNQYDALLYEAIARRLAADMAFPITGSTSLMQVQVQLYQGLLKEAHSVNGQEGTPDDFVANTLLNVR